MRILRVLAGQINIGKVELLLRLVIWLHILEGLYRNTFEISAFFTGTLANSILSTFTAWLLQTDVVLIERAQLVCHISSNRKAEISDLAIMHLQSVVVEINRTFRPIDALFWGLSQNGLIARLLKNLGKYTILTGSFSSVVEFVSRIFSLHRSGPRSLILRNLSFNFFLWQLLTHWLHLFFL